MTVGELKKYLKGVSDDSLPVVYLPDSDLGNDFTIKGALLVDNTTEDSEAFRGVYLLEG